MVNAGEVNAKLDAYMVHNDKRLTNIEESIAALTTALTAKVDLLTESVNKRNGDHRNFENPPPDLNQVNNGNFQANFHVSG